jgi:hypothetical protein
MGMRRLGFAAPVLIAAASMLAGEMAHAASVPPSPDLRSFVCRPALKPLKRTVAVTAVMPTMAGTQRLQMRFQLQSRAAGLVVSIRGGDLGRWLSPTPITLGQRPGDVWIVSKPVTGVPVPASYRFKVTFRWIGAGGSILGEAVRFGPTCRQPDLRPDLQVRSIAVQPVSGDPSVDQYLAVIANAGLSAATEVDVLFQPGDGSQSQLVTIPNLRPGSAVTEAFTGPACTAATAPTITIDPSNKITQVTRANDSLTATCPAGG